MTNELIVSKHGTGVDIALLCDKKLTELHRESGSAGFSVGDFYLGRIKKISPSLNAAFVDIGSEKDAFLHYYDLGPNVRSVKKLTRNLLAGVNSAADMDNFELEEQTVKTGKISQVFKRGDIVLVQVLKEPISNKGPKVGCDISFAGRYFVLVPFSNHISLSKKIGNPEEKKRLKKLAQSLKPSNFGVIIRTVAEGVDIAELDQDLRSLAGKWEQLSENMRKAQPGRLVLGEGSRLDTLLRDILNESFTQIVVNDKELFEEVREYVTRIAPQLDKIVRLHQGKADIFDHFNINRQIRSSFGKTVPVSGGAYLVVEHTEALHVFDVNSGSMVLDAESREENVLRINTEAVAEVARQIRLRDMGGIIVIDFIDMRDPTHKKDLVQTLRMAMKSDRARHTILPMSRFGLVEITRERVRPQTVITNTEACPSCNGTGVVESSIQLFEKIESTLVYLWQNLNHKKITLKAHPFIAAYITQGWPSIRLRWLFEHKRWLRVQAAPNYHIGEYVIEDHNGREISKL
jgi:ribonuclease G